MQQKLAKKGEEKKLEDEREQELEQKRQNIREAKKFKLENHAKKVMKMDKGYLDELN